MTVVADPMTAQRAVDAAEQDHDPDELKDAKSGRRRTWYFEVVLILLGYWLYSWVRGLVEGKKPSADRHADWIVHAEKWIGIYHERLINHWVAEQHWLAYICNYWYAICHFLVTIWVGVWIYRKHPDWARELRTIWYCMNVVALIGFATFPLTPPRLLKNGGFIDTVVDFHTWGSWGSKSVSKDANLYAAMPSMHIGWSTWVAIAVVLLARRKWVKVLGVLYPIATLFVIVGTANHYYLDAAGGLVALSGGILLARLISRRRVLPTYRHPTPVAAPTTAGVSLH